MSKPLHLGPFDCSLLLLKRGNPFIHSLCERYQTDIFTMRLLLRRTVCMRGPAAAEAFYHPGRMTRVGAIPASVLTLLQDKGSVATLDGDQHRARKHMFMSLMKREALNAMAELITTNLEKAAAGWQQSATVTLHGALQTVYTQSVCQWAGIDLTPAECNQRAREFAAMIDGAGSIGPRNWQGQWLRQRTERWARQLIRAQRQRSPDSDATEPLAAIAAYREINGELLPIEVAAVELINLLRPTVAVANYAVQALSALAEYPAIDERLRNNDLPLHHFIQEVRRYYPFFPFVGGIARQAFDFHGFRFEPGQRFLLDLYGTNHHPLTWTNPEQFNPDRFADHNITPYNFIPQGGGDFDRNHRCAGEWLTLTILRQTLDFFLTRINYTLPPQDLSVDIQRMPALPRSRVIAAKVTLNP